MFIFVWKYSLTIFHINHFRWRYSHSFVEHVKVMWVSGKARETVACAACHCVRDVHIESYWYTLTQLR